jgi:phosphoglycolate phosphatase-like HAD superfamily hydrolase
VLTGNIAPNARAKLSAFGLDGFLDLEVGAYGDEYSDRRQLLPVAWKRQRDDRGTDYGPGETWIVGDTANDLACARAGGAYCLLVATGRQGLAELEALVPDAVLENLTDTGRVVELLTG